MTTLILTFSVISLAATILLSQYLGAREQGKVQQIYTLAVGLNLILSFAITAGLLAGADGLFALMRLPAEALPEARSYLRIAAVSLPCQAMMLTFSAFLRAHARMLVIMFSTGCINLVNILGNTALIYGAGPLPRLGAAGAALSTSICRTLGMALLMAAFFRSVQGARVDVRLLRPFPRDLFRRLLGIGLPAGGEGLSYNLSQSTSLVFVNMIGTYAVTARMYMNMFAQICYMLVSAVSQAAAILIGYCIGAKDYEGADRQNWRVLRFSAPVTVGTALLLALFAEPLFGLFSSDPAVLDAAVRYTWWVLPFIWTYAVFNCMMSFVNGTGAVKYTTVVNLLILWAVRIPAAYILHALGYGTSSMACVSLSYAVGLVAMLGYFLTPEWGKLRRKAKELGDAVTAETEPTL